MTEYTTFDNKSLTEISDVSSRNLYLEQARKALGDGAYDMTYLPLAKDAPSNLMVFDLAMDTYSSSRNTVREDKNIVMETISKTFDVADAQQASAMIYTLLNYAGQPGTRNETAYIEIVSAAVQAKMAKSSDWANNLDAAAKLSLINVMGNSFSFISDKNFLKMDFPKQETKEFYEFSKVAEKLIDNDNKAKKTNRGTVSLPWELKAELTAALLNPKYNTNTAIASDSFADLVDTISNSGNNRNERVKTMSSIVDKMTESFDFIHNHAFSSVVKDFDKWFKKIPPCDETQKFYFTALKKFKISNPPSMSSNDINAQAYQLAIAERKADDMMDEIVSRKIQTPDTKTLSEISKFRMNRLLKHKGFSAEGKLNVLQAEGYEEGTRIPEQDKLRLMSEVMNEKQLEPEVLNRFISQLHEIKKVSGPEIKECLSAMGKQVAMHEAKRKEAEDYINRYQLAQNAYNDASEVSKNTKSASSVFETLTQETERLNKARKDKESALNPEAIEEIIHNAINGKMPAQIEYKENEGLAKMFTGKAEKDRQGEIASIVHRINYTLENMKNEEKSILKDLAEPFISRENRLAINSKVTEAGTKETQAQETKRSFYMAEDYQDILYRANKLNLSTRFAEVSSNVEGNKQKKTAKAREALSFAMQGQDFDGTSIFAESEKQAQFFYEDKVKELTGKVRQVARKNMEERGVFEKPDLDNPNKNGDKMTKENTEEAKKVISDRNMYKKLVDEKLNITK